jgi:hypothetical protein
MKNARVVVVVSLSFVASAHEAGHSSMRMCRAPSVSGMCCSNMGEVMVQYSARLAGLEQGCYC